MRSAFSESNNADSTRREYFVEVLAQHRDVHDLDVDLARRVVLELLRPAQVDDAPHAVVGKRLPAGVRFSA